MMLGLLIQAESCTVDFVLDCDSPFYGDDGRGQIRTKINVAFDTLGCCLVFALLQTW